MSLALSYEVCPDQPRLAARLASRCAGLSSVCGAPALSRRDHQRAPGLHSGAAGAAEPLGTRAQGERRGGTEAGPRPSTPHLPKPAPPTPATFQAWRLRCQGQCQGTGGPQGTGGRLGWAPGRSPGTHVPACPRGGGVPLGTAASGQLSPPWPCAPGEGLAGRGGACVLSGTRNWAGGARTAWKLCARGERPCARAFGTREQGAQPRLTQPFGAPDLGERNEPSTHITK